MAFLQTAIIISYSTLLQVSVTNKTDLIKQEKSFPNEFEKISKTNSNKQIESAEKGSYEIKNMCLFYAQKNRNIADMFTSTK